MTADDTHDIQAEFPPAPEPPGGQWPPPPQASAPAEPVLSPAHEPVWRGVDVAIFVLFTGLASLVVLVFAAVVWALMVRGRGPMQGQHPLLSVPFLIAAQTGGLAAGFIFAWRWIERIYNVSFWRAIRWRKISFDWVAGMVATGFVVSIGLQVLGKHLPVPPSLPIDQLFNSQTAWTLAIYGVVFAPFFEEFFFRGLIYPSLRASFAEGMGPEELRDWQPLIRLGSALGLLVVGFQLWQARALGLPLDPLRATLLLVGVAVLIAPQLLLGPVGWLLNRLARLHRPELLAIILTGILFGLVHSSQLGNAWAPVLLLSVVGILLTLVRARSGSVVTSWIFHCAYNGTLFVILFFGTKGFHDFTRVLR